MSLQTALFLVARGGTNYKVSGADIDSQARLVVTSLLGATQRCSDSDTATTGTATTEIQDSRSAAGLGRATKASSVTGATIQNVVR